MTLWLRGDDIAGADGAAISSWVSREGSSFDFLQATESAQPAKRTSGIGGQIAADCDGGDILEVASAVLTASAGTLFVVFRLDADTDLQALFSEARASGGTSYLVLYARVNNKLCYSFSGVDVLNGSTTVAANTNYIAMFRSSGTAISMRLNGADESLSVISGANNGDWFGDITIPGVTGVGAAAIPAVTQHLNGRIAEILHYNSALSVGDIDTVEEYLASRYGITLP